MKKKRQKKKKKRKEEVRASFLFQVHSMMVIENLGIYLFIYHKVTCVRVHPVSRVSRETLVLQHLSSLCRQNDNKREQRILFSLSLS